MNVMRVCLVGCLFVVCGFAQLDDRTITAITTGDTLCAQADDGEIGIAWHFTEGFEDILFLCMAFHDGNNGGALVTIPQVMKIIADGDADSIVFDSDFVINQGCSLVSKLSLTPSEEEEINFQFDISSDFKNPVGNCPVSSLSVTGTLDVLNIDDGFVATMDVEFSGDPTEEEESDEDGVPFQNILFGSVPFAPTANDLDTRQMTLQSSGETVCFQSDDGETGIAWHITDGFENNLFMCQVFHVKPNLANLASFEEVIEALQDGDEDTIVFDSDFKVTQDCSMVAILSASLSPHDKGSKTLFDITSNFKDVQGNCAKSVFGFRGELTIENSKLLQDSTPTLTMTGAATFSGPAVALSHILPTPRTIEAETHGLTLCAQADDGEPGFVWHFTGGVEQILYICMAFHSQMQMGKIIGINEAVELMQSGNEGDIIFDTDFTVSQGCSFVVKIAAELSMNDDGSSTLFDITSDFKDLIGDCPHHDIDVTGTMEIIDTGTGFSGEFNVDFNGDATAQAPPDPNVPGADGVGDEIQNRTLEAQTHGNTLCAQTDDGEEGIVWHFSDGFQQLTLLCQVYHLVPQKGMIIPLEDAIDQMLQGNAEDIIFDSDFVVDSNCSFVLLISASPSAADEGDGTLFDIVSKSKVAIGDCPATNLTANGTMKIVDMGVNQQGGAGLQTTLALEFLGDPVDNQKGGNNENGGKNKTNTLLLALTIVFAVLFVCAGLLLCFLYSKHEKRNDLGQRGSEMPRQDYQKMDA